MPNQMAGKCSPSDYESGVKLAAGRDPQPAGRVMRLNSTRMHMRVMRVALPPGGGMARYIALIAATNFSVKPSLVAELKWRVHCTYLRVQIVYMRRIV